VINTSTNTVVARLALGCGPESVAITPNGAFAYVGNSCDSTVSVINTATNTVVATVAVGGQPAKYCYYSGRVLRLYEQFLGEQPIRN